MAKYRKQIMAITIGGLGFTSAILYGLHVLWGILV